MKHVSKTKTLSFLAAAVLSAIPAFAQSTTRPAFPGERGERSPERMGGDRRFGDRSEGPGGGGGEMGEGRFRMRGAGRAVTAEQWEEIQKYMREVSPHRTAAYDEMNSDTNRDLIKKLVTARYDNLMNVKRDDPALYDVQVEKTKAEDSIFGILQVSNSKKGGVGEEEKKGLREQVAKLVDANLKEREMRIQKAERSLKEATARLEEDRKNKDALVDERLTQYLRDGARPLKMGGGERGDGGERLDAKREPRVKAD